MKRYKITMTRTRAGEVLDRLEHIVESPRRPTIGEGFLQLTDPPISNIITQVEEVVEDVKKM